jgi:Ni2+-binding GTPase involved in maturation of urease and hydrogenase
MADITMTIKITAEGAVGSGKTRAIDSLVQHLAYAGVMQKLARDEEKHTATLVIKASNQTPPNEAWSSS